MHERTVVLLGDSILDNGPYTTPEPDTTAHLGRLLGPGWRVRRLARDGSTLAEMPAQLDELEAGCDAAVLSIGGNDAVTHIGVLDQPVSSSVQVLESLLAIATDFERRYEHVARAVAARARRTILCTIYEAPLEPPAYARLAQVPLAALNDRIIRIAARLGLEVLELRDVCTDPADFVLQIEPSSYGAAKIAAAIAAALGVGDPLSAGRVLTPSTRRTR